MKGMLISLIILMLFGTGCASLEGTRNKSYTYKGGGSGEKLSKVVILPIEEMSKMPQLPDMLEEKITEELKLAIPSVNIINSPQLSYALQKKGKLETFSTWYSSYKTTKFVDHDRLGEVFEGIDAQFILSIRSLNIDREKIHAVDSGYHGMVSDATNVYRTNLKFIGELIDAKNKKIVWQGIGYSENISSPRRPIDLFFVIFNQKNPEVETFLSELITVASKGFVEQMTKGAK